MQVCFILQNKSGDLYQQLSLLSQMNGKAIEVKTDDAKASSKSALDTDDYSGNLMFLDRNEFYF